MAEENVAELYINDLFERVGKELGQNEMPVQVEAGAAEVSAFDDIVSEPAAVPVSVAV